MSDYPPDDRKKGRLWILRFIKLTYRVELPMELGAQAALLLQYVAMGEDRCDFVKPPRYFAAELMKACGCRDDEAFKKTRDRCAAAGWLAYQPGEIRQAGVFWVTIPEALRGMMEVHVSSGKTGSSPDHDRIMTGISPDHDRITTGERPVDDRHLSPLSPSPSPVCVHAHAPVGVKETDNRKQHNTERLKRALRRQGLSVRGEAVKEWGDFLTGACRCRDVDECVWAMKWLLAYGRDSAGIAVRFANHAAPMLGQLLTALTARRKKSKEESP
jgi:hypothetical protein